MLHEYTYKQTKKKKVLSTQISVNFP